MRTNCPVSLASVRPPPSCIYPLYSLPLFFLPSRSDIPLPIPMLLSLVSRTIYIIVLSPISHQNSPISSTLYFTFFPSMRSGTAICCTYIPQIFLHYSSLFDNAPYFFVLLFQATGWTLDRYSNFRTCRVKNLNK